jgi:putative endonuclease
VRGERAAKALLRHDGYRILACNLRTPGGEVDLLALDGETLVVVEVKSTSAPAGYDPAQRVGHAKRRRLRAARAWLAHRRGLRNRPFRFDVVTVREQDGLLHAHLLRGAFRA